MEGEGEGQQWGRKALAHRSLQGNLALSPGRGHVETRGGLGNQSRKRAEKKPRKQVWAEEGVERAREGEGEKERRKEGEGPRGRGREAGGGRHRGRGNSFRLPWTLTPGLGPRESGTL